MLFYAATLCANLFRGLFIVTLAWGALEVSGSVAAVGQIFVIGHVMNVVLGPGFGAVSDRLNRRFSVILGQSLVAGATALPFALWAAGLPLELWHLALVAFVNGIGHLFAIGALDGMLQQMVPPERRPQAAVMTNGLRQAAMVAGAGGGGYLIHWLGLPLSFLAAAGLSALVVVCILPLPVVAVARRPGGYAGFLRDIREGIGYFREVAELRLLAVATALGFSVGQLSNALLPGFVREIGGASDLYGMVDAGWSVGGISVAFLVGWLLSRVSLRRGEYGLLALLGGATLIFSLLEVPILLVLVHGVMGAAFSGAKMLADGRLLQIAREEMMGRVRANIQILTSLFGIAMYLSPTLLAGAGSRDLYAGWGLLVVLTGAGLWLAARKAAVARA